MHWDHHLNATHQRLLEKYVRRNCRSTRKAMFRGEAGTGWYSTGRVGSEVEGGRGVVFYLEYS